MFCEFLKPMRGPHPSLVRKEKLEKVSQEEGPDQPEEGGGDESHEDGAGDRVQPTKSRRECVNSMIKINKNI